MGNATGEASRTFTVADTHALPAAAGVTVEAREAEGAVVMSVAEGGGESRSMLSSLTLVTNQPTRQLLGQANVRASARHGAPRPHSGTITVTRARAVRPSSSTTA